MNWRVPLADLDYGEGEVEAAVDVIRGGWLTMGSQVEAFETAFAERVGVRHAIAVANATVGLHLAVRVLGVTAGDEVLVPSLTFVATANAVLYQDAKPVFVDIVGDSDLTIDAAAAAAAITPRTKAIIVMHYGGYHCDMPAILELADEHGLAVIEDAAHAPGSSLEGRSAGAWGQIGVFSFFSNKNLATGEGGMLTTDDDSLAEQLRLLRSHGMTSLTWDRHEGHAFSYDVVDLGYNYRTDEIKAALGLQQLARLEAGNERRRQISARYRQDLFGLDGISIPFADHPGVSAAHLFPVLLDPELDRNAFMAGLRDAGIQTSIHYPPIHTFSYYRDRFGQQHLPRTEAAGAREVTLPLYPGMTDEQVGWVVEAVREQVTANR